MQYSQLEKTHGGIVDRCVRACQSDAVDRVRSIRVPQHGFVRMWQSFPIPVVHHGIHCTVVTKSQPQHVSRHLMRHQLHRGPHRQSARGPTPQQEATGRNSKTFGEQQLGKNITRHHVPRDIKLPASSRGDIHNKSPETERTPLSTADVVFL